MFVIDLIDRTRFSLSQIRTLTGPEMTAHPAGHPNSIAWLLWHTGREIDAQVAQLSSSKEVWESAGFAKKLNLGEVGDTFGYGHTRTQAARINTTDQTTLTAYITATLDNLEKLAQKWEEKDWDEVIDTYEGEDITRRVRVTSTLIDAIEHLAQAMYATGMPTLGNRELG